MHTSTIGFSRAAREWRVRVKTVESVAEVVAKAVAKAVTKAAVRFKGEYAAACAARSLNRVRTARFGPPGWYD